MRTAAPWPKPTSRRTRPRASVAESRASGLAGLPLATGAGAGGGGAAAALQPLGTEAGHTRIEDARLTIAPRSANSPSAPAGAHSRPVAAPV
jgi:hypothetical protein